MEIFRIAGISLLVCCLSLLLKKESAAFSFLILLAGVLTVFFLVFPLMSPVLALVEQIEKTLSGGALSYLFKVLGIALAAQIAQELCKDAGAGALASMVELGGRALILISVFPLVQDVLKQVEGLLL